MNRAARTLAGSMAVATAFALACSRRPLPERFVTLPTEAAVRSAVRPPPARRASPCRVRGDGGDLRGRITIFATPDESVAVLNIELGHAVFATWTRLVEPGKLAAVEIGGQQMVRATGFAEKPDRFYYRRDVPFVEGHVTATQGSRVGQLLEERAASLIIREKSELTEPPHIEAAVPCDALSWGRVERRPVSGLLQYRFEQIALLEMPGGRPLLEIRSKTGGDFGVLEGGSDFVRGTTFDGVLRYEGWVARAQLRGPLRPGRDSIESRPDRPAKPRAPEVQVVASVRQDTPLWVGTNAPEHEIGAVERGALVRPALAGKGGESIVAFEFHNGFIAPPDGKRFFLSRSALGPTRHEAVPIAPLPTVGHLEPAFR